jgi:hypothetical protein
MRQADLAAISVANKTSNFSRRAKKDASSQILIHQMVNDDSASSGTSFSDGV